MRATNPRVVRSLRKLERVSVTASMWPALVKCRSAAARFRRKSKSVVGERALHHRCIGSIVILTIPDEDPFGSVDIPRATALFPPVRPECESGVPPRPPPPAQGSSAPLRIPRWVFITKSVALLTRSSRSSARSSRLPAPPAPSGICRSHQAAIHRGARKMKYPASPWRRPPSPARGTPVP